LARVMEPGTNVVATALCRRAHASTERGDYNFATVNLGLGKTERAGPANERKTSWLLRIAETHPKLREKIPAEVVEQLK